MNDMKVYDYKFYYDNGLVTELNGCTYQLNFDELSKGTFVAVPHPDGGRQLIQLQHLVTVVEKPRAVDFGEFLHGLTEKHNGDGKAAAEEASHILGLSPRTIYRKIYEPQKGEAE